VIEAACAFRLAVQPFSPRSTRESLHAESLIHAGGRTERPCALHRLERLPSTYSVTPSGLNGVVVIFGAVTMPTVAHALATMAGRALSGP
jgi:hypothetical protein